MRKTPSPAAFKLALLLLLFSSPLYSEENVFLPKDESAPNFYDAALNSDEVQLFLAGSWKIDLSYSGGFGWNPESGFIPDIMYSGISEGFSFSQSPDLTVSMLILNHFYFEAAFTDDFEDSTFHLGYTGSENDFVKSVSAGTMGTDLSEAVGTSDYFDVPAGGPESFGVYSKLAGPFSEHELLFRVDPHEELEKVYLGTDLVVEIEKKVSEYLRGRIFILPSAPQNIAFYIESSETGTGITFSGRQFAPLSADEYSYSVSEGRLILDEKPDGAILAVPVSDTPFIIYDPGIFSAYESAAGYYLNTVLPEDSWRTRVFLADSIESASSGIEIKKEIYSASGLIVLEPSAGGTLLYPLSGIISDSEQVYGSSRKAEAESSKKLIIRVRGESAGYSLDNPVEGSIRITVNGTTTTDWTLSGSEIEFSTPPGDEDRIVIKYRRKNSGAATDILFASANRFLINDMLTADLNAGVRFNLTSSYSLPGEETSSYGGFSAGITMDNSAVSGSNPDLKISGGLSVGAKVYTENSAGRLLLKNMSGTAYDFDISRNNIFPASLSERIAAAENITQADRGILLYKDYRRSAGVSGYYLQDYTTSDISESMIFSPADSTADQMLKAGPYTASASSDGRSGEILVMDYILQGSSSWTGVQLPLGTGEEYPDLSGSSALAFDCKAEGELTNVRLFIEIGSLSEDLDGDGNLDEEISEYSGGFIFNDANSDSGTLVGGDNLTETNGQLDTEDFNGNGFLDSEKSSAAVYFELTSKPDTDWRRFRVNFSDIAGSDTSRTKLENAGFIRITVLNNTTAEESGRILFDNFEFEGTSMTASDTAGYTEPDYSEVYESFLPASETPSESLSAPTIDSSSDNSVMRVAWSTGDWQLFTYINPASAENYDSIIFHYFCPSVSPSGTEQPLLHFTLNSFSGSAVSASVPLSTSEGWNEVSLTRGGVYINGILSETSDIAYAASSGAAGLMTFSTSGTSDGLILLDEIYLADPELLIISGVTENFSLSYSAPLLSAGGFEIIGPVSLSQKAEASFNTDTAEFAEDPEAAVMNSGNLSLSSNLKTAILSSPLNIDIAVNDASALSISAGHSLTIPLPVIGLSIVDTYYADEVSEDSFIKTDSVRLSAPPFSGNIIQYNAVSDSSQFIRRWASNLNSALGPFSLGLSAAFLLSDLNHSFSIEDYFSGWYQASAEAFSSNYNEFDNRKTNISFTPSLSTKPVGVNAGLTASSDLTSDGTVSNSIKASVSLPLTIKLGADTLTLELGYQREGSFSLDSASEGFTDDLAFLFKTLAGRTYLYESIPFHELFDDQIPSEMFEDCVSAGISSASLQDTASFLLSRNYTSSLFDLVLPYSLNITMYRLTNKDYSEIEDDRNLSFVWRSAAMNLFGQAGAYPLFDFYFSDEFNWSVEADFLDISGSDFSSEILVKAGCSFFGNDDSILSVGSTVYLPYLTDTDQYTKADVMYVWNIHPGKTYDLPFFSPEDEKTQLFINEERMSLDFEDTFSTELRHSTSLVMPGRFTLSAFILAGFEYNSLSDTDTALFGFSLGFSGGVFY